MGFLLWYIRLVPEPWGLESHRVPARLANQQRVACYCSRGGAYLFWYSQHHNKLPLKLHTALVRAIIHHSLKLHFAWLRCLHCMSFLFARTLHLPALTLCSFACLPAGLCWRIPPLLLRACESVWCLRGLLVRECPALVCACLPCACACALNAFRPHTQLR